MQIVISWLSQGRKSASYKIVLLLSLAIASSQLLLTISSQSVTPTPAPSPEAAATPMLPPFVGRVCLVPGDSTACPQTLPRLTADSTGRLDVSVNVLGSPSFNASGVYLHWDPTVMNATGLDLTNTILASHISDSCINNVGSGCGSHDGFGVAHLDIIGANTAAPSSGRLFKISLIGPAGADPHIGFATGCSTISIGFASTTGSVPNTDLCLILGMFTTTICTTLCIATLTADPESVQSQSLGVHLPTALSSVPRPGNITGIFTGGGAPNFADTWVLPYQVVLPGNITGWKAQFMNGVINSTTVPPTPIGIQLKVFRKTIPTAPTLLTVAEAGPIHDPRPVLSARLPDYPFVLTEWTVIPYYTDSLITVLPGDFIGLTIQSNSTYGIYEYPTTNVTGSARIVTRNVPLNGTINLADIFTGTLPGSAPAVEITIQPSPAKLDTPGDGIPDFVALSPEMQALGVDPCRKTVLVQLDYMQPAQGLYTFKPLQQALDIVTNAFDSAPTPAAASCPYQGFPLKSTGIKLIFDVRNAIPEQDALSFTHSEPMSFDTVKATYFDANRAHYFHYGLFINQTSPGDTESGVGETFGSNFIVSLGLWTNKVGSVNEQAGTLMHELGHNLGLMHGGTDEVNRKPNYLSVMSYEHQVVGIITKTPTGNVTRFDYSSQALPTLNETSLNDWTVLSNASDYTSWVCPDHRTVKRDLLNHPLDWSCSGTFTAGIVNDLNNDTLKSVLTGHDDWSNLRFNFVQSDNFNVGCRINCDIGCRINCDIGCRIFCDIGCRIGCDIGCRIGCDFGQELNRPTAVAIEASWAAYFSTPHRSTSMSVNCVPASVVVNNPSTCTASVSDADSGTSKTPTTTVSFLSSQSGTFTPSTCSLTGTGATATCAVSYSPAATSVGPQTITGGYAGDVSHLGSSGSTSINGLSFPTFPVSTNTTLTTDLTGRIVIGADNVTLNCNGHTIQGITTDQLAGAYPGILLNNRRGVIVENCRVTNFYIGIQLLSSTRSLVFHNSAYSNSYGYMITQSTLDALFLNNATNNLHDGFRLEASSLIGLAGNRANINHDNGFLLISSPSNGILFNSANGNGAYGFALTSHSSNNLVQSNLACTNSIFDAYQDTTSTGNIYRNNIFCKTSGLPRRT
ncbi:MAG TPA: right-handed parallel beta-helix repeat-containing protein [Candidatus Bathyarchaeia archaeon]|nr:right-handed parallel beta-helix repeat-containing protein [Candidatus Bathyarchaeia archaeon]